MLKDVRRYWKKLKDIKRKLADCLFGIMYGYNLDYVRYNWNCE